MTKASLQVKWHQLLFDRERDLLHKGYLPKIRSIRMNTCLTFILDRSSSGLLLEDLSQRHKHWHANVICAENWSGAQQFGNSTTISVIRLMIMIR